MNGSGGRKPTRVLNRKLAELLEQASPGVSVHGPRVTSVQGGTESQAIAGRLAFAVEWLEDEADAEPKETTGQGLTSETLDSLVMVRWTNSSTQ
jgi:hypothetical protein